MKIVFTQRTWTRYSYWQSNDTEVTTRINALIEECRRIPFQGTGKPEPLMKNLKVCWSRRIDRENRFVYRIVGKDDEQRLEIVQCCFHYGEVG